MINNDPHKIMLAFLLLLLCLSTLGCGSASSPAPGLPDLYVTAKFVNNSGISSSRIHVAINGYNRSDQWGYFDLSKDPAEFVVTSNLSAVPDVTLDNLISRGGVYIPYVVSGRMYLGIDHRIGEEAADFNQPGSASGKLYDKFEFTVKETGNVINLTQVDYFSFPLKITCGSEVRGFNDNMTRKMIFDDYESTMNNGWEKLVIKDSGGTALRVLNPAKIAAADQAKFPELFNYWQTIINEYWGSGKTVSVKSNEDGTTKTGTANGSLIDFGADGVYLKPNSLQLFGQEVAAGSDAKLVKWLSCAINRGVIKNTNINDQGDSTKFYNASTSSSGGLYNRYAEFLHNSLYTINGHAYALAFDDVFGMDSALGIPNKGTVTVQLQAFN